ncbi:MAG: hypothetical protein KKF50_03350 [Nanoarchaeota archaeon]|nr:hypothetical protein [Nanoarchaeota archaeon]
MKDYHCDKSGHEYCLLRELLPQERLGSMDIEKILENGHTIGEGALIDISDGCDNNCIRKQIAAKIYTRRSLEQLRSMEDFKFVLEQIENREIDSKEGAIRWVADGFAEAFAKVYSGKKSRREIIKHWDLYVEAEKKLRGR